MTEHLRHVPVGFLIGTLFLQATDGIFDNVPDRLLIEAMDKVQHCKDKQVIQQCANSIALMARKLSRDPKVIPANFKKCNTLPVQFKILK